MPQGQQSAITAGLGSAQTPKAKTRRQLLADMAIGGRYNLIVGPASTVAGRRAEGGRYARCCRCSHVSHVSHGSMPQAGISGGGPSAT